MKDEQDEEEKCFFIPRVKRTTATLGGSGGLRSSGPLHKKPRGCYYEGGVLIIDEASKSMVTAAAAVATTTVATETSDVEFVYAESAQALERNKDNALVSAVWAVAMYMEPENVMHCCMYWIAQYANYKEPESQWFNDLIRGVMYQPIRLSMSANQGIAHTESKQYKYTLLMHVAGSSLHKIPDEYFIHRDCLQLMECHEHFLTPANKCFLTTNTFELNGEVNLATFQYNRVLSYFYEPSFFIITAYMLYVHYLASLAPHGVAAPSASFLPIIKTIMRPIKHKHVAWDMLLSMDRANSNYVEKRRVFEQDLEELHQALNHLEMDRIKDELAALWSKKATYVTDLINERFSAIYTQLYVK